jgi:hypothetical protein
LVTFAILLEIFYILFVWGTYVGRWLIFEVLGVLGFCEFVCVGIDVAIDYFVFIFVLI